MELRQLRYFVAVARHRHFTRAAAELLVAQPALSQQIRQLERELGVVLLERTKRHVQVTAAGEAFLLRAERILNEVASATAEMLEFSGLVRGRVVIGSMHSQSLGKLELPVLLAGFHALYPGIEIVLREETTEELLELLRLGQVDLALAQETGAPLGESIVAEQLFSEDLVLVLAPTHPLAIRQRVRLRDLRDESFIIFKPGSGTRHLILRACAAEGITLRIAFESGELATLRALASLGLGVAIMPRSVAGVGDAPLALVDLGPPAIIRTVSLFSNAARYCPPAAVAFLAYARSHFHR